MTPLFPRPLRRHAALLILLAAICGLTPGCAVFRWRPTRAQPAVAVEAPNAPPVTANAGRSPNAPEGRVGTVRLVGRGGRFVLVETLSGGMLNLPDGQELHCRTSAEPGAVPTANLRLSRERRQQFSTADVIEGAASVGDAVFIGGPGLEAAIPGSGHLAPSLLPAGAGGLLPPPAGGRL